jgi:hypothetical protein
MYIKPNRPVVGTQQQDVAAQPSIDASSWERVSAEAQYRHQTPHLRLE